MPRKDNRAAAKHIATAGALWDRRRADRKARKNALKRQDAQAKNPRRQHLDKKVRESMLASMPGWVFDHRKKAFTPAERKGHSLATDAQIGELLDALSLLLPSEAPAIRIRGLESGTYARAREYLDQAIPLVQVP